jgi:hypothetical protein
MRSVAGHLGKDSLDGSTKDRDPSEKVTEHLRLAFEKPVAEARMIFLDVNAPPATQPEFPRWAERATQRLEAMEKDTPGQVAYVFVTNFSFHRALDMEEATHAAMAHGLNIHDFAKPGAARLIDVYHAKQKHLDAHRIMDAVREYPKLPTTFDGTLLSDAIGDGVPRIEIGKRYFFESHGFVAIVTEATVAEQETKVYVGVSTDDGGHLILTESMTDAQLADYKAHPDAYFGVIRRAGKTVKDVFELFEWMVDCYKDTPRDRLIEEGRIRLRAAQPA